MTEREAKALRFHNSIFTKSAIKLIRLHHLGAARWHLIYADGHSKWDYECGDAAWPITAILTR